MKVFCSTLVMALLLKSLYDIFIQGTNEYIGYQATSLGIIDFLWIFLSCGFSSLCIRNFKGLPSDLFCIIYSFIVVLPYSIFHSVIGANVNYNSDLGMVIVILPLLIIWLTDSIRINMYIHNILPKHIMDIAGILFLVFTVAILVSFNINSASFSIEDVYIRRLEAREYFQTGELKSYLFSIVSNSGLSYIAFRAGCEKNYYKLFAAISGWLLFYYFAGLKAPLLYISTSFFLGISLKNKSFSNIFLSLPKIINIILVLSLAEIILYDYSYLADYFIRRLIFVQPLHISNALRFVTDSMDWSSLSGLPTNLPFSVYLGNEMGDQSLNANVNTFVYSFVGSGVFLYSLDIILLVSIFILLNSLYKKTGDPSVLWIAGLFSTLMLEQSLKTSLLSSGIVFFLIYLMITAKTQKK